MTASEVLEVKTKFQYSGLCVDCEEITTNFRDRYSGDFVCANCNNKRYTKDLENGFRVEMKIDLREYSQGTLE